MWAYTVVRRYAAVFFVLHEDRQYFFVSTKKYLYSLKFPLNFINLWVVRWVPHHKDEIRPFGIGCGKTKRNRISSIFISCNLHRDSSGGKILCTENAVPADPESAANSDNTLLDVNSCELSDEKMLSLIRRRKETHSLLWWMRSCQK